MQQGTTQRVDQREIVSTLTRKGQVTIPVTVRRHLGVGTNDKVAFIIEHNGGVKVSQVKYPTIQSLRGAAGSLKKPIPWKQLRDSARQERIDKKYGK